METVKNVLDVLCNNTTHIIVFIIIFMIYVYEQLNKMSIELKDTKYELNKLQKKDKDICDYIRRYHGYHFHD